MTTNTKALWSALIGIVLGFGGYVAWHGTGGPRTPAAPAMTASSTESVASTSEAVPAAGQATGAAAPSGAAKPAVTQGAPVKTIVHQTLAFDTATTTTSSPNPQLTGTASNIDSAQVIIYDADDVGLLSATVPITDGHWAYTVSRALKPGTYTAVLAIPGLVVKSALIVTQS